MTGSLYYSLSRACVLTVMLVCLQQAGLTLAEYDRVCDFNSQPHPNGLCGSRLVDTIMSLCASLRRHHLNNGLVKRNVNTAMDDTLSNRLLNKKDALSYLAKRQSSGSIVCECCFHQCTVYELYEYCSPLNQGQR